MAKEASLVVEARRSEVYEHALRHWELMGYSQEMAELAAEAEADWFDC